VSKPGPHSERAVIVAPNGRDAEIARQLLREAGFPADVCGDLRTLTENVERGAGLAIIADDALHGADLRPLADYLARQPSWSDFPIILLTRRGGGPERNPAAARLAELLGNVIFLERPFHPTTLISIVHTAVRSRRRQYEARRRLSELEELLGELAAEREALARLSETLEQRVQERTAELMKEVSARERVQEQLLQSQKMESIGKLTGGVAHDFNNLLMAVIGNLDLLKKRLPDDTRSRRLIDGAMQGAERGAALTQRMLAFARQQELDTQPSDVGLLLAGMADLLQRTLGPQITLRFDLPPDLPFAQIDANQVELAILNLAINSRDAMPEGGTIDIKAGKGYAQGDDIRPGPYVWISVADTGYGMDADTLKRAVEPFYSTKTLGKGTGLGLSMVHGLAVQLGGKLELESEPGRGTTAVLWLPAAEGTPALDHAATSAMGPMRMARILVVDDDPLIAMSAMDMLEDLGHTVIEANSGKQALEILEAGANIDLLITDHAMPGMTGTELATAAHQKRPSLPVLLTTGYADLPNGQKTDLPRLSKPYHQEQLRAEIDRLLSREAHRSR
jgi:signal transduction histidine kinase